MSALYAKYVHFLPLSIKILTKYIMQQTYGARWCICCKFQALVVNDKYPSKRSLISLNNSGCLWNIPIVRRAWYVDREHVVLRALLTFVCVGPGNCIGLLASKSSPTAIRGQFYGIAAAIGKLGAFVGTWSMWICSPVSSIVA